MLSVNNVSVKIGTTTLLNNVSLKLMPGEVLAVVGPNGAGKSTLMKVIANELSQQRGTVKFHNQTQKEWDTKNLARHFAVLPQQSVLNFPFTGREVVELARTPHSSGAAVDDQIVDEVLEYLDASYLADRIYPNLSGGEKQRIQLARVLAQIWQPVEKDRLLVLDEPSASFDLEHQQILISTVKKLASDGIGILIVLHDLNMALCCADKVAVLCCGELRALGTPNKILNTDLLKEVFGVNTYVTRDPDTGQQFVGLIQG